MLKFLLWTKGVEWVNSQHTQCLKSVVPLAIFFEYKWDLWLFWKCSSVIICESGTFALLVFCATTQTYYGLPNSSIFLEVSPKLPLKVHCLNSCDVFNDFRIPTKGAGGESGSTEKRGNWGKEEKWGRKEKVAWKERPSQRLQIKVTFNQYKALHITLRWNFLIKLRWKIIEFNLISTIADLKRPCPITITISWMLQSMWIVI